MIGAMSRTLTLVWLTVVAGLPLGAHAMGSARELADDCRSLLRATIGSGKKIRIPFTKKALVCWGYMQAMQDLSVLADEHGRRFMGACPPERTTLLELMQAFVTYARSHELPDNAALAVTRALHEAFPCGDRESSGGQMGAKRRDAVRGMRGSPCPPVYACFVYALNGTTVRASCCPRATALMEGIPGAIPAPANHPSGLGDVCLRCAASAGPEPLGTAPFRRRRYGGRSD
jgi:Rap1a immunity proteins